MLRENPGDCSPCDSMSPYHPGQRFWSTLDALRMYEKVVDLLCVVGVFAEVLWCML